MEMLSERETNHSNQLVIWTLIYTSVWSAIASKFNEMKWDIILFTPARGTTPSKHYYAHPSKVILIEY